MFRDSVVRMSLFRLFRRAWRERKKMAAWNPGGEKHATIFSSRFSSASRTTDYAKEGLLVV